jgi:hypothetical protein
MTKRGIKRSRLVVQLDFPLGQKLPWKALASTIEVTSAVTLGVLHKNLALKERKRWDG